MKRTFLAIEISANKMLSSAYSYFQKVLADERIKWVDANTFHITLFFLGETHEDMIPSIISDLEQSISDIRAFNLTLKGSGVFPSFENPAVLWIGVNKTKKLETLKQKIDKSLEKSGYLLEKRQFRPHLTIARIKQLKDKNVLIESIDSYNKESPGQARVDKLIFFESRLTPSGPVYDTLREFLFR